MHPTSVRGSTLRKSCVTDKYGCICRSSHIGEIFIWVGIVRFGVSRLEYLHRNQAKCSCQRP